MKRKMLFMVLLLTMVSFSLVATPQFANGYDPPGTEQTIDKTFIKFQISLPMPVVMIYELQSAFAPEVAQTSKAEMVVSECTSQSNVKLNLNYLAGCRTQIMPRYSMAS